MALASPSRGYIPDSDADALAWMLAFSGGIAANPGKFMLQTGDADAIVRAVNEYRAAYDRANDESTRTKAAVSEKNETRTSATQLCRLYATYIKHNVAVSNQAKIDIGVRPENRGRQRRNVPRSEPLLQIIGSTPTKHVLRYRDANTPNSSRKPFGATHLLLFAEIARPEDMTGSDESLRLIAAVTKNPIQHEFELGKHAGMIARYKARWLSGRGDMGPMSAEVSMVVPFGSPGSASSVLAKPMYLTNEPIDPLPQAA